MGRNDAHSAGKGIPRSGVTSFFMGAPHRAQRPRPCPSAGSPQFHRGIGWWPRVSEDVPEPAVRESASAHPRVDPLRIVAHWREMPVRRADRPNGKSWREPEGRIQDRIAWNWGSTFWFWLAHARGTDVRATGAGRTSGARAPGRALVPAECTTSQTPASLSSTPRDQPRVPANTPRGTPQQRSRRGATSCAGCAANDCITCQFTAQPAGSVGCRDACPGHPGVAWHALRKRIYAGPTLVRRRSDAARRRP